VPPPPYLGEFELLVLLAVLRTGPQSYGVPILDEIAHRTGRAVARGAVYVTLERLEQKGYLGSSLGDPTPERGGRAKRYYTLTRDGQAALRASRRALERMWEGLDPVFRKP
jgi:DNA-binding PadR family transcriptional regulator